MVAVLNDNNVVNSCCLMDFVYCLLSFVFCCLIDLIRPSCMLSGDRILCELVFSGVKLKCPVFCGLSSKLWVCILLMQILAWEIYFHMFI